MLRERRVLAQVVFVLPEKQLRSPHSQAAGAGEESQLSPMDLQRPRAFLCSYIWARNTLGAGSSVEPLAQNPLRPRQFC